MCIQNTLCCFFTHSSILSQHAKWYSHHWDEIDHSDLILGVEQQLDLVSSLPVNVVRELDIYQYIQDAVYTIQTSAPMVEWLRRSVDIHVLVLACTQGSMNYMNIHLNVHYLL